MILPDVNVLIYAFDEETPRHADFKGWLEQLIAGEEQFGLSDQVLSGFLRIVTNPRIFDPPSPLDKAIQFVETLRGLSHCVPIHPGPAHWDIFIRLCQKTEAKGNIVADAYLAALAIESGSEWITTDRDFARFPGLRWRHPLQE